MEKEEIIKILEKRIKYLKQNMNLTRKAILRAQSNKDFKSAIANIRQYEKEDYALYELRKFEKEINSTE